MRAGKRKESYEECRRKRLEENKKRLEALNLPNLALDLRNSASKSAPKSKPSRLGGPVASQPNPPLGPKNKQVVEVRRSSRFKEVVNDRVVIPGRDFSNQVYASDGERDDAIERAEKLQSTLESHYPNFIKPILPSYVSGGWLSLSVQFCKTHLPSHDGVMTLIDEDGNEYPTTYLARKTVLSSGWKRFSVAHDLVDGDVLIFQLIQPTVFKVYIIRVNNAEQGKKAPDKPKRPASAFFIFMEEFRKQFNKENPNNKAVSAVGKAAGEKWKALSEADKVQYVAKAVKRKVDYEKDMKAYKKKKAEGANVGEEEGSEKSLSEVNNDDGNGEEDNVDPFLLLKKYTRAPFVR
ncbi:hypothetical protein UlMin_000801 [Ulmus minor]